MPLKGFLDRLGNKVSFAKALTGKSTLDSEFTRDILFTFVDDAKRSNYGEDSVSITALNNCLRKTFLERTTDYYMYPLKLWYAIRGTKFHLLLDPGDKMDDWISERRFFKILGEPLDDCRFCGGQGWSSNPNSQNTEPCGCCSISGQIDGYDVKKRQLLDKKTLGDNGLVYLKDGAKDDYVRQVCGYKWLLQGGITYKLTSNEKRLIKKVGGTFRKLLPPLKNWYEVTLPVDSIRIQHFTMMDIVITGGEMRMKTGYQYKEPPVHPSEVRRNVIASYMEPGGEKKRWELIYSVPNITEIPEDQVVSFIQARREELVSAFQGKSMPPMRDDSKSWICDFCGCTEACAEYEKRQKELAVAAENENRQKEPVGSVVDGTVVVDA